ncbi:Sec-independent protein translocase protein TatC domain protein [Leptospira borgpetersenii str. 200701203]|uniref:Sec-independent protein translocase protein TatC domain protein n=1 Tax=Leptospira borgpetersenii str. 200701203 TaxID=1193007 RepID=M3HUF8_LEPBO|nr:Sec-independent protein translocase protein TatC domain protein [Leptospira borgpetersenii str. 200701203]
MKKPIHRIAKKKKSQTTLHPDTSRESVSRDREKYMTLGDHLEELRMVLLRSLLVIAVIMGVSLFFGEEIHKILAQPYKNVLGSQTTFYQIKLMAPFMIYLKSSFMISILLGLPFVLFFLWGFISPALDSKADRYGKFLILFSTLLFGSAFGFVGPRPSRIFLESFSSTFAHPTSKQGFPSTNTT